MSRYCVNTNAQDNGDHEVHNLDVERRCLPNLANRRDLGWHPSCQAAVRAARTHYRQVNGCALCASACHTG
ncbi:hypothetical protein GCM10025788_10000 [Serinicoccus chungangensis]